MSGGVVSRRDGRSPRCGLRPSFRPDGQAVESNLKLHQKIATSRRGRKIVVPGRIVSSAREVPRCRQLRRSDGPLATHPGQFETHRRRSANGQQPPNVASRAIGSSAPIPAVRARQRLGRPARCRIRPTPTFDRSAPAHRHDSPRPRGLVHAGHKQGVQRVKAKLIEFGVPTLSVLRARPILRSPNTTR
jgi:hypothetical protein